MTTEGHGLAQLGGPVWLDVTRLLTRVGRGALSGIDRVELAYLDHLRSRIPAALFLCRTTRGYLLLGPTGAERLSDMVRGKALPERADMFSVVTFRGEVWRHRAEGALRPLALARCRHGKLPDLIKREGPPRIYLNTGHSSLTPQTLAAFGDIPVAVLIHDLIPITHPELVPKEQPTTFSTKLETVRQTAALVIANSSATAETLTAHWEATAPPIMTAPLGIDLPDRPPRDKDSKMFVMIGTIEPRKNHEVVLRAWKLMADSLPDDDMPHLHIIGAPGWHGGPILHRIRAHPQYGTAITYHGPLPDGAASAYLAEASALLYPSLAEGFGLPPFEAVSYGARPICSDLPVLRRGLGPHAVYVDPTDAYAWMETIKQQLAGNLPTPDDAPQVPSWQEHFDVVAEALLDVTRRPGQKG